MEPWYRVATPRREVREGRSFNPDGFAVRLEQVVAGSAPEDYQKPEQFFRGPALLGLSRTTRCRSCAASEGRAKALHP
jgi:hypothetical protein